MIRKVKNWLGIESVDVELTVAESINLKSGSVTGTYSIVTQSEQHIRSAEFKLVERYKRGRRKSKLIDEYVIGRTVINIDQTILPDEEIKEEFDVPFQISKSGMERFGDKNFVYKGLSKLAKLAKNASSEYYLIVELDVQGNRLKPYDKVELVKN
ncbi:MAG: hypothetical protein AAFQ02_07660 [Bacteroidota bacterium]